jgi:hypothetical protein
MAKVRHWRTRGWMAHWSPRCHATSRPSTVKQEPVKWPCAKHWPPHAAYSVLARSRCPSWAGRGGDTERGGGDGKQRGGGGADAHPSPAYALKQLQPALKLAEAIHCKVAPAQQLTELLRTGQALSAAPVVQRRPLPEPFTTMPILSNLPAASLRELVRLARLAAWCRPYQHPLRLSVRPHMLALCLTWVSQ